MMDIGNINLEPDQELPKFVEPYEYGQHETIDLSVNDKPTTSYQYYAKSSKSPWHKYAMTTLGNWLCYYDPNISIPPEQIMHSVKFIPKEVSESTGGYSIYTITTLLAQQQLQNEIRDAVVVDLGSGDGIQALTSLKLGAKHVILFESNLEALQKVKNYY